MKAIPKTLPAFIWHFIKQQKWSFTVMMLSPLVLVIESNILPYATKLIVDRIIEFEGDRSSIWSLIKYPVFLFLGSWTFMVSIFRIQEFIGNHAMPKFQASIRMSMFDYTKGHSYNFFANNFAGSLANKISDITRGTSDMIDFIKWRLIGPAAIVVVAIIMMWQISWHFALVIFIWFVVDCTLGYFWAIRINEFGKTNAEDRSVMQGKIVDTFSNIMNMRLFSRSKYEDLFVGGFQEIERRSNKKTLYEIWKVRMVMEPITIVMFCAIFFFLIRGWQQGTVTAGDFVFILYATLGVLWNVWLMLAELPMFFANIGVSRQALSLVVQAHDVVDNPGAKELEVNKGEIKFDNVGFYYVPGKNIFKDKNIHIKPGEKVGLVGFSGSGKSTFVNLILRFFDVESGRILIDGQDVSEVTQHSLRSNISMIPQDTSLFHRSLMENIRYGKLEATDEEVIEASKKAHCHEFIKELKEEYEALVGERGVKLSGGQRQRIAIARAILKDAPILILDEATSSLDSVTEKYIQQSLDELMKGKTTIVIAHRLSTLSGMDRILVFDKGEIIQDGSHLELLKKPGHYKKLWDMQAGGFLPEL